MLLALLRGRLSLVADWLPIMLKSYLKGQWKCPLSVKMTGISYWWHHWSLAVPRYQARPSCRPFCHAHGYIEENIECSLCNHRQIPWACMGNISLESRCCELYGTHYILSAITIAKHCCTPHEHCGHWYIANWNMYLIHKTNMTSIWLSLRL